MSNKKEFVNLHAHSGYSIGDGMGQPSKHIDFAIKNGLNAHAFTDHGNMSNLSAAIQHQKKVNKEGKNFKLINGVEAYFVPSIEDWKKQKEQFKIDKENDKKNKVETDDDDDNGAVIEDESETKSDQSLSRTRQLSARSHLVLLAKNRQGLSDLFKLVSQSYQSDNYYRYPRIDYEMLQKYGSNLIVTSACAGGILASTCGIFNDKLTLGQIKEKQLDTILKFKRIFGERFFLELQWNAIPEQHKLNQLLIELSKETDTKLISTADCHYPDPKMWKDREVYKKLAQMTQKKVDVTLDDIPNNINELKYQLYPKNAKQMIESYEEYSNICGVKYDSDVVLESIYRTHDIAYNMIENYEIDTTINLPKVFNPEGKTSKEHLRDLCYKGLSEKKKGDKKEYIDRIEYELDIISKRDMSDYFIITYEAVKFAKQHMSVSIGRGSCGGALIAYCLGISEADPVKFGFQFERFLLPDSTDWPDIDTDIESPAKFKKLLNEEWSKKYGLDVLVVPNYNTLNLKSLTKDLAKLNGVEFQEVNEVTNKMLFEAMKPTKEKHKIESGAITVNLEDAIEFSPTFQKFLVKYPNVANSLENIQGQIKSLGVNAGGICISDDFESKLPLITVKSKGDTERTLRLPFPEGQRERLLEPMGFLKFDFLGLSTLEMRTHCIRLILRNQGITNPTQSEINEWYDKTLHPDAINFSDQKVWEHVFHKGNFMGIFQFSQKPVQEFAKRVKPVSFDEGCAITAIFRPGPLAAKVDQKYIEFREMDDNDERKYEHPLLKKCFGNTHGFLIYQEQIAGAAKELAGFSLSDGNKLRKLLVKRGVGNAEEKIAEFKTKFMSGCRKNLISDSISSRIWLNFERSSQYLFNFSHCGTYFALSYQCAWLLTYFPQEWACSFLDKEENEKKEAAIGVVKSQFFKVGDLSINDSDGYSWSSKNDTLMPPLSSIKGLGDVAISEILRLRPFNTIEELLYNPELDYRKLNIRGLGVLGRSGALKSLMDSRFINRKHFCTTLIQDRKKKKVTFQDIIQNCLEECKHDYTKEEEINNKVELTGVYPIEIVLDRSLQSKLQSRCIPPISEHDLELGVSWCVPREIVQKKTGKGSDYYIVKVTDSNSALTEIKCWSINPAKDKIYINHPYAIKLDYDDTWGFSTRKGLQNWRLLA